MFIANTDKDTIHSGDLLVLDGIASWCGALHGSMNLAQALKPISIALDAEVSAISRHLRSDDQSRQVAEYDSKEYDDPSLRLRNALARDVLGQFGDVVRSGTSWFMSEHSREIEVTEALSRWQLKRGIVDISVVTLQTSRIQHDYLEFHFTKELSDSNKTELSKVFQTLSHAWAGRQSGLVTQARMDARIVHARERAADSRIKSDEPILGVSNPANLSRAEFRVCLCLSRGLSIKGVTDELGLTEATIRSHLRSIYSKSNCAGISELLYRLLSYRPVDVPTASRHQG